MDKTAKRKSLKRFVKFILVLFISLCVAMIVCSIYYMPADIGGRKVPSFLLSFKKMLRSLESSSRNFRFIVRTLMNTARDKNGNVVRGTNNGIFDKLYIAAIDDETIESLGGSYPLDRKVYADFLNKLNKLPDQRMPRLVFFDIVFVDPSQNPQSDKALVEAFSNYRGDIGGDIMLDIIRGKDVRFTGDDEQVDKMRNIIYAQETLARDSARAQSLKRFEMALTLQFNPTNIDDIRKFYSIKYYPKVSSMLPEIAKSLDFVGVANIDVENEEIGKKPLFARTHHHFGEGENATFTNIYYPSIVLSMSARLLGSDISNVTQEEGSITIKGAVINGQTGDFRIPVNPDYSLSINYRSMPNSGMVRVVPFADLTNYSLPDGAIVFIGMYSKKGAYDIWDSPVGKMYGIEHIANALGTIMNRDFLVSVPDWVNIAYIFAFSAIIGLFVSMGIRYAVGSGIVSVLVSFITGIVLFNNNLQIITVMPLLAAVMTLVSVQIYILLTEQREKKFIKTTFSKYVNPTLVDILIQNPDMMKLGGTDKEITVFFSSINYFSDLSSSKKPMDLIELMNQYFSKMTDIVMETNGTIDKYIGDVLMAFWGAPIDAPDHALKCCKATMIMQDVLEDFNREIIKKGEKPIKIDIGMNTGKMIVGNVGSEKIKNYTVMGDSVNLASRVKGLNKFYKTHILMTEYTYQAVKDSVIVRELDLVRVKGKVLPVRMYELFDVIK